MRVFALTLGTRGDLELTLAIAHELAGRGHQVTLGSSPFFEQRARALGLGFITVGRGSQADLVALMRSLASVGDLRARSHAYFNHWVQPQLRVAKGALREALAECDYFINNLKLVPRRDGRTIPVAPVQYEPTGDPAKLARHAPNRIVDERVLRLVALERALVDPEEAWGNEYRFTGFWRPKADGEQRPCRSLQAFIEAGTPPIVLAMGSMTIADPRGVEGAFRNALERTGRRGVIVRGWSELRTGSTESVHVVSEAPYRWLFRRVACVIHHGGCGTVHSVLEAGRPSVLLPQVTSQSHFARILKRERLATAVLAPGALDAGALASAIEAAVHQPLPTEAARRWQRTLESRDGLRGAADMVEAHASRVRASATATDRDPPRPLR